MMNHTGQGLPASGGNTTMDLTAGTATLAAAADRYGAHHRCKESPSFLRKQEPSFLRKQEPSFLRKQEPSFLRKQESKGNGHHTRKTDKKMEASVEARHSCESKPVIPAKAGIQKIELIEKSNPERVNLYEELV